VAFAFLPD